MDRLTFLLEKVGLGPEDYQTLAPHREYFIGRGEEFSQRFSEFFLAIPATNLVLEHQPRPGRLADVLAAWFSALFSQDMSPGFMASLWSSGARHVDLNLDQRYVNLGYSVARQFCQEIAERHVPQAQRAAVLAVIDKMLDVCALVATDSFVTCTSRCDRQVIAGIAHQVRNPITVIGGSISRLQRQTDSSSRAYQTYETVLSENRRLERMLKDIVAYTELFQAEPKPRRCELAPLLGQAAAQVALDHGPPAQWLALELDPENDAVLADPSELALMFFHLLENAVQAAEPAEPLITARSHASQRPGFVTVEIIGSGQPPDPEQMAAMFQPFTSSKPMGTGFGLPIAALVARRNMGTVSLEPRPGGGGVCTVRLPRG